MIKILVDEDMPRPTADLLRSLNIDAFDVREIGLRGATDQEIFKYAQKKGMIIISRDKGFSSIVKYPVPPKYLFRLKSLTFLHIPDKFLLLWKF